jgi:hypothetical protein
VAALKKLPTAVGLLLIFAGLALVSSYNSSVTDESWETVAENTGSWNITGNFNSGENMTLIIAWSALSYGEDWGELPANVTITANSQSTAEFQVYFLQNTDLPSEGQDRVQVYVSRIELLYNDGYSLSVDNPPKQIGGIVKQAGTFEARVHPPVSFPWAGYPEPQPPTALNLLKVVARTTYPYRGLLPVGAATGFVGVIASLWGAKASRNTIRKRRERKIKSLWQLWLSEHSVGYDCNYRDYNNACNYV